MDRKVTRAAFLAAALVTSAAPALAQVDDRLATIATAWTEQNDFNAVVKTYAASCIIPVLQALPDAAKQTIAAGADLDAGLETLDLATQNDVFGRLEPCVSTMFVGDQAWVWVATAVPGATDARRGEITVCLMDAVAPLSSDAKRQIILGADFGAGLQALVAGRPDLAGDVQARVQACL